MGLCIRTSQRPIEGRRRRKRTRKSGRNASKVFYSKAKSPDREVQRQLKKALKTGRRYKEKWDHRARKTQLEGFTGRDRREGIDINRRSSRKKGTWEGGKKEVEAEKNHRVVL